MTHTESAHTLQPRIQASLLPPLPATKSVGLPCATPSVAVLEHYSTGETTEGNSGSLSRLRRLKKRFQSDQKKLLEVTRLLTSIQEPQALFDTLVEAAADLTEADRGLLLLRSSPASKDPRSGLELMASYRLAPSVIGEAEFSTSRSAITEAIARNRTVVMESSTAAADPSMSMQRLGIRSVLVEPITLHGQVLGVLYLDSESNGRFVKNHVEMLPSFAAQAAICLENLRLVAERERALRKQYEEQAKALELQVFKETMSSFLRMASHDLKSPLTVLKTGLAFLKRSAVDAKAREMVFEDMEEAVDRANRLVSSYLDMEAMKSGQGLKLEKQEVAVRELVEQEIELLKSRVPSGLWNRISFKLSVSEGKTVWADRERLSQIIGNILSNSVKYSPHGGEIEIHHSSSKNHDIFSFTDQGMGMSESAIKQALIPFSRGKSQDKPDGAGLGLHIVKQLIEAHKGAFDIESNEGAGTVVWVAFPKPNASFEGEPN